MSMDAYLEALAKAIAKTEIPELVGASGYFSKPQDGLDPNLFDGTDVKPEVRKHIVDTLFRFWKRQGYHDVQAWSTVWLAGSGASYQWAGDRGNGDLDVLMGVNWPAFYRANPRFSGIGIDSLTVLMDDELRSRLWPRTAHTKFGSRTYEVTYFVNADATDIRNINPYAAYDLTFNSWTVVPSRETAYDHPGEPQWYSYARTDLEATLALKNTVEKIKHDLPYLPPNSPYWNTALHRLANAVDYGVQMMGDIHGNRHKAFERPLGKGYWDFHNWRWQKAKEAGIVRVLKTMEDLHTQAQDAAETATYGAPLAPADELVRRATLAHREE
jgi:hypothetical protein